MNEKKDYLKIKSKLKYSLFLCVYFFLYPICKLLYGRKNNWLICERGDDAQDNGFIFFKYLIDHNFKVRPTFLIKKSSPDFLKVASIGRVVEFGSVKHFMMAIGCPVKISSNLFGYAPWVQMVIYLRRNKTRSIHVFLQHGIIKNFHDGLCSENCKSLNLFICGAKPEYEYILNDFHYRNKVPQYTGLARYDFLVNYKTKNQLLIMPTWRSELSDLNEPEFICTDFYKKWAALINNSYLLEKCRSNNIIIKFYLHYAMQKYSYLFQENDIVRIVRLGEETVQNLLKESQLLITDFSSVFFDFGYMNKPVVYFQFDESTFFEKHYAKGYFDYRRDGFGDVCSSCDETVNSIIKIIDNSYKPTEKYINRMNSNFIYRDNQNCERIFNAIKEIQNGK